MEPHEIYTGVLRIGHRPQRDKRITTHTALVARAFGASEYFLADTCDWNIIENIMNIEKRWGKTLSIFSCGLAYKEYIELWRKRKGIIVHLTMYGLNINDTIDELRKKKKPILIIIGAEKTPREIYEIADYNIAVGNQPHSEVAALAVFLDRLYNGQELNRIYEDPQQIILPTNKGKKVIRQEEKRNEEKTTDNRS